MRTRIPGTARGWALIELAVLLAMVAILAAVAVAATAPPAEATLPYQAHRLARDIRHMQTLAQTWGRPLRLTAIPGVNGSYSVSCVTAGVATCDASPVLDPTNGEAFSVTLQKGVALAVAGENPADLDSQGRPLTSLGDISTGTTTYTLTSGPATMTVAVQPITGFALVTP
jgi:type II secretory pathway pseudopilin PulG